MKLFARIRVYQTEFTPHVSEISAPRNRSFFALMIAAPSNQSRHLFLKFLLTWKQEDERKLLLPSILTPSLPPSTHHTFYFSTSIPSSAVMSCFGRCTALPSFGRVLHMSSWYLLEVNSRCMLLSLPDSHNTGVMSRIETRDVHSGRTLCARFRWAKTKSNTNFLVNILSGTVSHDV